MHNIETIRTWDKSDAMYVAGNRYTNSDGGWVEIGDYLEIGQRVNIGGYVRIGCHVKIGDGVKICDCAKICDYVQIGRSVKISESVQIGDGAKVGDGVTLDESPCYLWPSGGEWPVCVADPEKRLVSIGCQVHTIDFWLNGGADKVREQESEEDTKAIYDPALQAVATLMGWLPVKTEGGVKLSVQQWWAEKESGGEF